MYIQQHHPQTGVCSASFRESGQRKLLTSPWETTCPPTVSATRTSTLTRWWRCAMPRPNLTPPLFTLSTRHWRTSICVTLPWWNHLRNYLLRWPTCQCDGCLPLLKMQDLVWAELLLPFFFFLFSFFFKMVIWWCIYGLYHWISGLLQHYLLYLLTVCKMSILLCKNRTSNVAPMYWVWHCSSPAVISKTLNDFLFSKNYLFDPEVESDTW